MSTLPQEVSVTIKATNMPRSQRLISVAFVKGQYEIRDEEDELLGVLEAVNIDDAKNQAREIFAMPVFSYERVAVIYHDHSGKEIKRSVHYAAEGEWTEAIDLMTLEARAPKGAFDVEMRFLDRKEESLSQIFV